MTDGYSPWVNFYAHRWVQKRVDAFVDFLAQPGDLALRNSAAAHGLHQVIHGARRDALDVRLLDHRRQRLATDDLQNLHHAAGRHPSLPESTGRTGRLA